MTFTHALATNRYGEGDLIVSTNAANGTHTTLTSALAAATSGQTIFLRDSVTENVTLVAGVNIAAWTGGSLNTPTITGKLSFSSAGTVNISGIRLTTNSDNFLAVTGSAASIVNLTECYLNCSNNTGISFTSSSSSAIIYVNNCVGDLGTTGIAYHSSSSAGTLRYEYCNLFNSGASTTASSNSAGTVLFKFTRMTGAISTSSTGNAEIDQGFINTSAINTAALTTAGTGGVTSNLSLFSSGTASAISIGSGTSVSISNSTISSSNTNAITGAGSIGFGGLVFSSSSLINTTTQTQLVHKSGLYASTATGTTADLTYQANISGGQSWIWGLDNSDSDAYVLAASSALGTTNVMRASTAGEINYPLQPAFLTTVGTNINDVTGDGTAYTVVYDTEIFDQGGDLASGVFTAPVTGRYQLSANCSFNQVPAGSTAGNEFIATSNRNYRFAMCSWGTVATGGQIAFAGSVLADMDAGDTASVSLTLTGSTKTADVNTSSWFSGILLA